MVNRAYWTRVNINLTVTQKKIQNEDSVVPRILCTRDIKKNCGKVVYIHQPQCFTSGTTGLTNYIQFCTADIHY